MHTTEKKRLFDSNSRRRERDGRSTAIVDKQEFFCLKTKVKLTIVIRYSLWKERKTTETYRELVIAKHR